MNTIVKRGLALVLALVLCLGLVAGVTVSAAETAWTKVTDMSTLKTGDYIAITSDNGESGMNYFLNPASSSNKPAATEATMVSGVPTVDASMAMIVELTSGGFYLKNTSGKYLKYSDSTTVCFNAATTADATVWSWNNGMLYSASAKRWVCIYAGTSGKTWRAYLEAQATQWEGETVTVWTGTPAAVETPDLTTPAQIVDAAYALASNTTLPGTYTLTGVITGVNSAWSDTYNNISVTIAVAGKEDKPIQCYRLASGKADASVLKIGDTITVTGILKNYNGTIEFDAGCTLDAYTAGNVEIPEVDPTGKTPAQIVDLAYNTLLIGQKMTAACTLTGVVTAIDTAWDSSYENITVTMVVENKTDKPIMCFRLVSGAADASAIAVGNTITVTGTLKNHNGTVEFDQGCTLDARTGSGSTEQPGGDTPVISELVYVTAPEAGAEYYMGLFQAGMETPTQLFFTGKDDGRAYWMATDSSLDNAVKIKLEAAEGGYNISFMVDGAKKYIVPIKSGDFNNINIADAPGGVWTWNTEHATFVANIEGTDCIMASRNTYDNFEARPLSEIASDYPIHLYSADITEDDIPVQNPDEEEEDKPSVGPLTGAPTAGTKYLLGLVQGNLDNVTLYFAGSTANKDYYLTTTENPAEAAVVIVEEVDGGYRVYFMQNGKKMYIDIYQNGDYVNLRLTETPSAVYTWNTDYKTFQTTVGDNDYYIGTYNSFDTLSASKLSYIATSFPVQLYSASVATGDTSGVVYMIALMVLMVLGTTAVVVVNKKTAC